LKSFALHKKLLFLLKGGILQTYMFDRALTLIAKKNIVYFLFYHWLVFTSIWFDSTVT